MALSVQKLDAELSEVNDRNCEMELHYLLIIKDKTIENQVLTSTCNLKFKLKTESLTAVSFTAQKEVLEESISSLGLTLTNEREINCSIIDMSRETSENLQLENERLTSDLENSNRFVEVSIILSLMRLANSFLCMMVHGHWLEYKYSDMTINIVGAQ